MVSLFRGTSNVVFGDVCVVLFCFFFSSRRRHTRLQGDWSSDVCSSDLFEVNYRLAPQFTHPAMVEDIETAIRWVKKHAMEYHLDPQRIALAGESAGGHLEIGRASCRERV